MAKSPENQDPEYQDDEPLGERAIEDIARGLFLAARPEPASPSAWEELPEAVREHWRWEAWRRARNYE